ncbi:MAG: hypothetical protein WCQ86_05465 [Bacteroidaceae bacterium]
MEAVAKITHHNSNQTGEFIQIISAYPYSNLYSTQVAKQFQKNFESKHIRASITYAGTNSQHSTFFADQLGMESAFVAVKESQKFKKPRVIILIGDEAWLIYQKMAHSPGWAKVPIVVCGIRPEIITDYNFFYTYHRITTKLLKPLFSTTDTTQKTPMTAAIAIPNITPTLNLISKLFPENKEIVYLSDNSYRDALQLCYLKHALKSSKSPKRLKVLLQNYQNEDSIAKVLSKLPVTNVVISQELAPAQSSAPIFTLRDHDPKSTNNSIIGGYYAHRRTYVKVASDMAIDLYKGKKTNHIPPQMVPDSVFLNMKALKRFGVEKIAQKIPNVVYINESLPFFIQHHYIILSSLLVLIILSIIAAFYYRHLLFSKEYKLRHDNFNKLLQEYEMIYDHMAAGILFFDEKGDLISLNYEAKRFLQEEKKTINPNTLNLFQSNFSESIDLEALENGEILEKIQFYKEAFYRIVLQTINEDDINGKRYLMLLVDHSAIEKERLFKQKIQDVFNFVTDTAKLGVAEYNVLSGFSLANKVWYENLGHPAFSGRTNALNEVMLDNLIPEDKQLLLSNILNICTGKEKTFWTTVCVKTNNELHYLRYYMQLLEYEPGNGRILIGEFCLNIDEQKKIEEELTIALKKAQDTFKIKQTFINSIQTNIQEPLSQLIEAANELIRSNDPERNHKLNKTIEENNTLLLHLLDDILDFSKVKL